jgi:hypothetical protein
LAEASGSGNVMHSPYRRVEDRALDTAYGDATPRLSAARVLCVFILALGAATALRYSSLFPSVIDGDESLYAVMAQHWLRGELPYQAVWDQHSVGLPALFAAVEFVFGNSIVALRATACVAVAIAATAVYLIVRLLNHRDLPAIIASGFYIFWTARWWGVPANCELYLNALTAVAFLIVLSERQISSLFAGAFWRFCLAGLLLGVALQVKQVTIAETATILAFIVAITYRLPGRFKLFLATGFFVLLPTIGVAGYFWLNGLGAIYFQAVVISNITYVAAHPGFSEILTRLPRSFVLPIGLAVAASVVIWRGRVHRQGIVIAWTAAAGVDVILPGQFWTHYFLLLLPGTSVLAGSLVEASLQSRWYGRRAAISTGVIVIASLIAFNPIGVYGDIVRSKALQDNDAPREIADRIRPQLSPSATIFVFNYQPVIYFLVGSKLPTNHVMPDDWGDEFRPVTGVDPLNEMRAVFATNPEFIIVADKDRLHLTDGTRQALLAYLAAYDEQFEVVDTLSMAEPRAIKIYRRRITTHEARDQPE